MKAYEGRTLTDVCSRCTKDCMSWACPRCHRTFRQVNQRHACGVGSAATLLKSRPPALTDLYRKLETTVRGFGDVEVVTRNRYALFRTTRIFADLTVMRDALRVVIHLGRKAGAPYFIKIVQGDNRLSPVALGRPGPGPFGANRSPVAGPRETSQCPGASSSDSHSSASRAGAG